MQNKKQKIHHKSDESSSSKDNNDINNNDSVTVLQNEKEESKEIEDIKTGENENCKDIKNKESKYDRIEYNRFNEIDRLNNNKECKTTTNITIKKEKHCGILKEKPPLEENSSIEETCCNEEEDYDSEEDIGNLDSFINKGKQNENELQLNNKGFRQNQHQLNKNEFHSNINTFQRKPALAIKISKLYGIEFQGCNQCRDGVSCSENDNEIKFSSEYCCVKEIETIFSILKLRRIFKDKTFISQGYKYKTDLQIKVLTEILKITPYPNAETLENLAIILNLKPRSVQIWFQNARQGEYFQFSKNELKGLRRNTKIDIREILEIFVKVCYENK